MKIQISTLAKLLNPNVPNVLIVELVDFNSPVNQDEIIKVHT